MREVWPKIRKEVAVPLEYGGWAAIRLILLRQPSGMVPVRAFLLDGVYCSQSCCIDRKGHKSPPAPRHGYARAIWAFMMQKVNISTEQSLILPQSGLEVWSIAPL